MRRLYYLFTSLFSKVISTVFDVVTDFKPVTYKLNKYQLIKTLKRQGHLSVNNVGIYKNKDGKKLLLKGLSYSTKNLSYSQLVQEMNNTKIFRKKLLGASKKYNVILPEVIDTIINDQYITFAIEFIPGKTLANYKIKQKITALSSALKALSVIYKKLSYDEIRTLPKRSNFYIFISFPIFFIAAMIKLRSNYVCHLKMFLKFFYYFNYNTIFKTEYSLSHRDLHSANLMIHEKKVVILDPAIAAISQNETDLAIVAKYYYENVHKDEILSFIESQLSNNQSINNFIYLSIYYVYQGIIVEQKKTFLYNQAKRYTVHLEKVIIPYLTTTISKIGVKTVSHI